MDTNKICIHCMGTLPDPALPCPHCGKQEQSCFTAPDTLPPRSVLKDRFLLGRVLRKDETGFIYLALDQAQNKVCAVREFFPAGLCSREGNGLVAVNAGEQSHFTRGRQRMLRQAEVLGILCRTEGEAILAPLDQFEENGTLYLVTEYQNAQTMAEYVSQHGKLSTNQAFALLKPIAQTLIKLHSFGVYHGSVRPERIAVLADGRAILPDFGGEDPNGGSYVPPEQRQIGGFTGPWTDAYAFAGCLYFCMTGAELPENPEKALKRMVRDHADLDKRFLDVLLSARSMRADTRTQNLEELLHAMQLRRRGGNPVICGLISTAACCAMIFMFLMGGCGGPEPTEPPVETTQSTEPVQNTEPAQLQVQNTPASVTLGSYILQNYADPSLILGIEGGYCDNGARLILTDYAPLNHNRILITDHVADDGFYNLQAAHTNSFLRDEDEFLVQYFAMEGLDSEKWVFLPCGEVNGQKVYAIRDAAGRALAPAGALSAGSSVGLSEPDNEDPSQMWYLIWSERDMNVPSVTVYRDGDAVPAPEGNVTVTYYGSPWVLNSDGILTISDEAEATELRFEPLSDGTFRIRTAEGQDYLEYIPGDDHFRLQAVSDSPNQCFELVYAGFQTYQIRTADGTVLCVDPSDSGMICAAAEGQSRDLTVWSLEVK